MNETGSDRASHAGRLNWRAGAGALDWVMPLGLGLGLGLILPLRTALQFGDDEGFEVMKALLVSLGHPLYREVWDDQPPLHTELVALLFGMCGPSALVGRALTLVFAVVLLGALYGLARARSGRAAGMIAVGLLVASPVFLELSVSVMLEVPAIAVGLAAVWAWSKYEAGGGKGWLVGSGVLFGGALQVKFTAMILGPALAADYLAARWQRRPEALASRVGNEWGVPREVLVWGGTMLAVFGFVCAVFYRWDTPVVFWGAHFSAGAAQGAAADDYRFRPGTLLENGACVPAVAGLVLIACRGRLDLLFPVVSLATASLVHWWHRPYWDYYQLHFAIPLAWLGAVGITEGFGVLRESAGRGARCAGLPLGAGLLGWSIVVAVALTFGPEALGEMVRKLRIAHSAARDVAVQVLRRHAAQTHWVFTDRLICAFWAGLPTRPELTVLSLKRIWSGQIDGGEVRRYLEIYRPELILLGPERIKTFDLPKYLGEHYRLDTADEIDGLYIRRQEQ